MLQLTPQAAERISELRAQDHASSTNILRISQAYESRKPNVRISFVADPHEGDAVGESQGIRLCVDPAVADLLDEMVLDRQPEDATGLFIRPAEQEPAASSARGFTRRHRPVRAR